MEILNIYLSAEHNFVGHYGEAAGTSPIKEVDEVRCVARQGLEGDRFLGYKGPDYKGQATFFSIENYHWLCKKLDEHGKDPSVFRRNVLVRGADLPALVGETFEVQGIRFEGTEEAAPCVWMEEAFGPTACRMLTGRGGLRVRILDTGILRTERRLAELAGDSAS